MTVIQKEIEEVEKELTKELKDENNERDLDDTEGEEVAREADQEIVSETTTQQADLKAKKAKATSKKEGLVSRT